MINIKASLANRIAFVSYQNDIAIISNLAIENTTEETFQNLELSLVCNPPIIGSKIWKIDRLSPKSETHINNRTIQINNSLLTSLNERVHSDLTFSLYKDQQLLTTYTQRLTGLAYNEWGGTSCMEELLAAFVMPNDQAISKILKRASEYFQKSGEDPSLNGYQSKSRKRVWQLVSAFWNAIYIQKITYTEPPASFEKDGQKIRTPSEIWDTGLATCLDIALLFSAALEQIGLHTLIILTKGHALCGVWLQPQHLSILTTDDASELRKYVALKELIVFEATLVTNQTFIFFSKALEEGERRISENLEHEFIYALDIKQARRRNITPLYSASQTIQNSEEFSIRDGLNLEKPPSLPEFDLGLEDEPASDNPQSRLEHWKRKLLDLTKNNRLLNLKPSKTMIRLICPKPELLEDDLSEKKKFSIIPKAKTGDRDEQLIQKRMGKEFVQNFSDMAFSNNELVADLEKDNLQSALIELYRKFKTDLQEGGANTLFISIGILRWKQAESEERFYRAPLILIPVTLERKSVASEIKLIRHEDDPVFNMTLLEMLRKDFQLRISLLENDLPKDQSGLDVKLILEAMRKAVRDIKYFEVIEEVFLGIFSFSKYLMWKDLSDRTEILKTNLFVNHLINHPREQYKNSSEFINAQEIDEKIDPSNLYLPLSADSSQVVAIHASTQPGDFVLQGPPGTGKSQTIANIIAHNLGLGKKILFVSEKMAALQVVYERLKKQGLGNFCLELHSNKSSKQEVLNQLGDSWKSRDIKTFHEWQIETQKLKWLRDSLNRVVKVLHEPGTTGISPYQAIGRAVHWRNKHRLELLDWPENLEGDYFKTPEDYRKSPEVARNLGLSFSELPKEDITFFKNLKQTDWSHAWEQKFLDLSKNLINLTAFLLTSGKNFYHAMGLRKEILCVSSFNGLNLIATSLQSSARNNLAFALQENSNSLFNFLEDIISIINKYNFEKSKLSYHYSDQQILKSQEIDFEHKWLEAQNSWPLVKHLRKHSCIKKFKKILRLTYTPKLGQDLPILKNLYNLSVQANEKISNIPEDIRHYISSEQPEIIQGILETGKLIRQGVFTFSDDSESGYANCAILRKLILRGQDLLSPGMLITESSIKFIQAFQEFSSIYEEHQKHSSSKLEYEDFNELKSYAQSIIDLQPRINRWCHWKAACQEAEAFGMRSLISALELGNVGALESEGAFKTAYYSWLAPKLIDAREELRNFSRLKHEDKIENFRKLDEEIAKLSIQVICAQLNHNIPSQNTINKNSGYGILRHELQKKRYHKPVRQLINEIGEVLTTLTPCVLMSPLSIAQFLSADNRLFDLVIFDEASQITVWDAIGAIARGKNVIIVGDPKQMPPTNFFSRSEANDDLNEESSHVEDLESILDEAIAAGIKLHPLTGHYRSRHESLIAFSNYRYYKGELITYPSSETKKSAVTFINTKGLYQKSKGGRINPIEAAAVVLEILRRLRNPELKNQTLGVVTMNSEQQKYILDLLEKERRQDPSLEEHFGENNIFVKNLETVQGDERDIILISIGYGPDIPLSNTMSMNFGPLNRTGGERRLNVAITRAAREVVIFTSFDPSMIDLTRVSSSAAMRDLKLYLEFAQRGPVALLEAIMQTGGSEQYDSDFERSVAEKLREKGWQVHTQIGVSRFRIDLGIVHPEKPGNYLAGIECDGAAYHSSPSARDRDRIRHNILLNLGWKLIRIWSTDYFIDPEKIIDHLDESLRKILAASKIQEMGSMS